MKRSEAHKEKRRWRGWVNLPVVKPVAIFGTVYAILMTIVYIFKGTDIPPNIAKIVHTVFLACWGIYGVKSMGEHMWDSWTSHRYGETQYEAPPQELEDESG